MKNNLPDNQSNFLLYTGNDGKVNIEVFLKDETVWLTQKAMAELFCVNIPAISKHLSNIFENRELQKEATPFHFGNSSNGGKQAGQAENGVLQP